MPVQNHINSETEISNKHSRKSLAAMKTILIVGLFALAGFAQAVEPNKMLHEECAEQEDLNLAEISKMPSEDVLKNPSKNLKCFHKCIMEKLGILKDGKLVDEKIMSDIINKSPDKEKISSQYAICKDQKPADDPCDTAFNYFTCMMKPLKP